MSAPVDFIVLPPTKPAFTGEYIIAWPAAYFAMQAWLNKFAYRTGIQIWIFFLAAAIGLVVAQLTVSLQTLRAARANPVSSLKYE
jgi:putative ABC transport system permease protein